MEKITTVYSKLMATMSRPQSKAIVLWVVAAPYAEMFIKNGWRKFDPEGFWSNSFLEKWGYPLWFMFFIGFIEVVAGVLLLYPKTRPLASLSLAIVMIGAVFTRTIYGFTNGFRGAEEGLLEILNRLDLMFFLSTIAIFLYFFSMGKSQKVR